MKKKYKIAMLLLTGFSIVSKLTGMLRESFIASAFGTSYQVDAYNIAFIIPFLLFSLIGPALTTTFIPILSESYEKDGKEKMYNLANNVISLVLIVTIIAFTLGEFFPNVFVKILAPNFNYETYQVAITLTKISMINVLFIGLNYGFIAILNVLDEFTSTGTSGLALNLPIIIYVLISKDYNINLLMFYTMIGYGVQILIHIPYLKKHNYKFKFKINLKDNRLKKMMVLIIPIIFGIGINQINVIVDRMMASGLQTGTIAAIGYANKTNEIFYTLFTSSVMLVLFPMISKQANLNDKYEKFKINIMKIENITLCVIIPITLILAFLRQDILTVLFKYGAFNDEALEYTATALLYLSFSTIFYSLRDIYNKGLLALQDTKTSVKNTTIGMVCNIVINLLLTPYLGVKGICIATTVSSMITCILLRRSLYKKINKKENKEDKILRCKIYFASILTIIMLMLLNDVISNYLTISSMGSIIINGIISVVIYLSIAYVIKIDEIVYILRNIKIKFIQDMHHKINDIEQ